MGWRRRSAGGPRRCSPDGHPSGLPSARYLRYLRYLDDSEELYDLQNDPEEWHNLAAKPEHAALKAKLAAAIPKNPAPLREETLIELEPHHVRPILSKQDYKLRKSR